MKLFILLILLIGVLLFNGINGNEYVNFIPYSNDECVGDEIGIGYSSLLSKCLPSIDSQQNYLFTLKPKNIIEWKVFKYSNKNDNHNDNCNLNKTIILQPSFTTKIGSCISSEYMNLDSKISLSSSIYYKISITKNSPYISAKSIVNSFTLDKKCSSSSSSSSSSNDNVLLIQYFTNHLNVNYKNKISYHCINDKPFTKNQFQLIEAITQECIQFKNGAIGISNLIKNKFVDVRFSSGDSSGSGGSSGSSGGGGGEDSTSTTGTTGNTGDSSTGNTGESSVSSISSSTGANSDTTGNSGFSSTSTGANSDTTGDSGFSSTTDVTTATSATTGGATSGDDGGNDGTGAINFINYKPPNTSSTHHKIFKKTYCSN
ncbi:hypothetical protein ACTFIZ_000784 [Dictyostelium cf. discoideum]